MKWDFKFKSKKCSNSIIPMFYFSIIILSLTQIISNSNEIIIKILGTGEQSLIKRKL